MLTALLLLLMAPNAAEAHTFPVERSAVLQVHTAHAELLLLYREPPGARAQRILALYDQNKNGEIDGLEQRLALRMFLQRAFFGLDIGFSHKSAKKAAEIRYKRDPDGGISVAILQRIDLVIDTNQLTVQLALAKGETIPPIDVIVEPIVWNFVGKQDDAKERTLTLHAGDAVPIKLTRAPTPASAQAP